MNRKTTAFIAALSLIAIIAAGSSIAYRVFAAQSIGKRVAAFDFETLSVTLASVHSSEDLADPVLRAGLVNHYRLSPSLLLVAIYDREGRILWQVPRDSGYLPGQGGAESTALPRPRYPAQSSILVSAPLRGVASGALAVDALYTTLDQATVFLAFRDALIGLGIYLALIASLLAMFTAAAGMRQEPSALARQDMKNRGAEQVIERRNEEKEPSDHGKREPQEEVQAEELSSMETEGLYSPRSGLGWESYMRERLEAELARSASFEQDLCLVSIACDTQRAGSPGFAGLGEAIREFFGFRDLAFERGESGFTIILPNQDLKQALRNAEEFLHRSGMDQDGAQGERASLHIGLSSRAGRLVDAERVIKESLAALERARADDKTRIVAFRPDPDKYRSYLASQRA